MKKISDIAEGHLNEFLRKNEEMQQERLEICSKCPICDKETPFGYMCSDKLWIHPATNEVSSFARDGFIRGCGCRLNAKTTLKDNHCIINKW
jgi:hypothetical protein